ncbi:hypothetical protein QBC38DRAFT_489484 [Podospora fimiseda]|uniref:Uncharacterized protein n=1 Tax=Podospora fimiseda TaxID=252190 RepID=A0AAN6YT62_9PEZI|nr:hypothetical protein QBC38DRAFT_489484 [Podospora fimiseda]
MLIHDYPKCPAYNCCHPLTQQDHPFPSEFSTSKSSWIISCSNSGAWSPTRPPTPFDPHNHSLPSLPKLPSTVQVLLRSPQTSSRVTIYSPESVMADRNTLRFASQELSSLLDEIESLPDLGSQPLRLSGNNAAAKALFINILHRDPGIPFSIEPTPMEAVVYLGARYECCRHVKRHGRRWVHGWLFEQVKHPRFLNPDDALRVASFAYTMDMDAEFRRVAQAIIMWHPNPDSMMVVPSQCIPCKKKGMDYYGSLRQTIACELWRIRLLATSSFEQWLDSGMFYLSVGSIKMNNNWEFWESKRPNPSGHDDHHSCVSLKSGRGGGFRDPESSRESTTCSYTESQDTTSHSTLHKVEEARRQKMKDEGWGSESYRDIRSGYNKSSYRGWCEETHEDDDTHSNQQSSKAYDWDTDRDRGEGESSRTVKGLSRKTGSWDLWLKSFPSSQSFDGTEKAALKEICKLHQDSLTNFLRMKMADSRSSDTDEEEEGKAEGSSWDGGTQGSPVGWITEMNFMSTASEDDASVTMKWGDSAPSNSQRVEPKEPEHRIPASWPETESQTEEEEVHEWNVQWSEPGNSERRSD